MVENRFITFKRVGSPLWLMYPCINSLHPRIPKDSRKRFILLQTEAKVSPLASPLLGGQREKLPEITGPTDHPSD